MVINEFRQVSSWWPGCGVARDVCTLGPCYKLFMRSGVIVDYDIATLQDKYIDHKFIRLRQLCPCYDLARSELKTMKYADHFEKLPGLRYRE